MEDKKFENIIEILKMFNIIDIVFLIVSLAFSLIARLEWHNAILFCILFALIEIVIKTFLIIGINKDKQQETALLLIADDKNEKITNGLKNSMEEICHTCNYQINLRFVNNKIWNIAICRMNKKWINLLYGYKYIIKVKTEKSTKNGKKIQNIYTEIQIVEKELEALQKNANRLVTSVCDEKRMIFENNIKEGIEEYNGIIIYLIQFIIATTLLVVEARNVEKSEEMLEKLLKTNNQELNHIKEACKILLNYINYYKIQEVMTTKVTYTDSELEEIEFYLSNMNRYKGYSFEYNNTLAIVQFYRRQSKKNILYNLKEAEKRAETEEEKVIVKFNLGFIYLYYGEYTKGISQYKNNIPKMKKLQKDIKNHAIDGMRDFINNLEEDRKVIGCLMAKVLIDSMDDETKELANEEFASLAYNPRYIKLSNQVKDRYEALVKEHIYKEDNL